MNIKTWLPIVLFALFATACNTMQGFGRDVEAVGGKIESAAKR